MALSQLFRLLRGYPGCVPFGDADRPAAVESHCWDVADAGFWGILEVYRSGFGSFSVSLEKIFVFFKNFVCICGKMGYNREYENL
jgi:hypothetical protein